jgi:arabinogalactan endo-1,4-beta-galactosidase
VEGEVENETTEEYYEETAGILTRPEEFPRMARKNAMIVAFKKTFGCALCLLIVILACVGFVYTPDPMVFAVDPSEAYGVLDAGGKFLDAHGHPAHPLALLKKNGYQWVRLRIMVDPNGEYGLFQDLSYVLRMARDVKHKFKLKLLLDFHYSHWWVDGQNQWSPDRWRTSYHGNVTIPMEELVPSLYQYTHNTMQVLKDADALPDAVQVGNEISVGMLWPHGKLPKGWDKETDLPQQWYNLAKLLQAGTRAVRDSSPKTKIMIHLDTGGDAKYTSQWMETFFRLGGETDIIGLSWYPMWHGTVDDLVENVNTLNRKFPKQDVWLVETAYYYEGFCADDDINCKRKFPFPMTEQGQADFLDNLRESLLRRTKCKAIAYWGSHWTQPNLWFRGGEDWDDARRRALFDPNGKVLKGFSSLPGTWWKNKFDRVHFTLSRASSEAN